MMRKKKSKKLERKKERREESQRGRRGQESWGRRWEGDGAGGRIRKSASQ